MYVPTTEPEIRATFAHNLRAFRERRELTTTQVADATGLSYKTIWAYEAGTRIPCTFRRIVIPANAVGVPCYALIQPNADLDQFASNVAFHQTREELAEVFQANLLLWRTQQGLNHKDLGAKYGMIYSQWRDWENGRRGASINNGLLHVAEIMQQHPYELLTPHYWD